MEEFDRPSANTLRKWLDRAVHACFIVTSREVLGIPGEEVLVISKVDEWDMLSALAFEKDVVPWPGPQLSAVDRPSAQVALVKTEAWSPSAEWREIKRARGWIVASRSDPTPR